MSSEGELTSHARCKLTCRSEEQRDGGSANGDFAHYSVLWPRPREITKLGDSVTHFNAESVQFQNEDEFKVRFSVSSSALSSVVSTYSIFRGARRA